MLCNLFTRNTAFNKCIVINKTIVVHVFINHYLIKHSFKNVIYFNDKYLKRYTGRVGGFFACLFVVVVF